MNYSFGITCTALDLHYILAMNGLLQLSETAVQNKCPYIAALETLHGVLN